MKYDILIFLFFELEFSFSLVLCCWRATHVANVPAESCTEITEVVLPWPSLFYHPTTLTTDSFGFRSKKSFYWFCDSWGGFLALLPFAINWSGCCFSLGLVSNSIQSSENSLPKCLQWHVLDYRCDVVSLLQLSLSFTVSVFVSVCHCVSIC